MTLKTLLLSFLTTCTAHSAVAQTLGGVEYSPKATTFHITTSPDVKKVNILLSDTDSDTPTEQMIKLDLDDGVKHNYEIFKDVLAKIK